MDEIIIRLQKLESLIIEQNLANKQILNFNEASKYLELSHSHLYKLTSASSITFYKPTGKKLYFKREDLDNFRLRNRSASISEIEAQAENFTLNQGRVKK
jgi:excisionase family DNA binding protein